MLLRSLVITQIVSREEHRHKRSLGKTPASDTKIYIILSLSLRMSVVVIIVLVHGTLNDYQDVVSGAEDTERKKQNAFPNGNPLLEAPKGW